MPRPTIFQRKFYVHPIQRKYLVLSLIPLILCCFAIIALATLPSNLLLLGASSEFEQSIRASCFSVLGRSFWPAIFVTMLVVAGASVLVSHTLGGPLFRLEAIGKRLAAGELPDSVHIRHGDDLQAMAASLDGAVQTLRVTLIRIQEHETQAQERLTRLERDLADGKISAALVVPGLEEIGVHLTQIDEAVHTFRLEPPAEKSA